MAIGTETGAPRTFSTLRWGPIIAGALLALAAHVVLGLIGAAIGFAAEPADSRALGAGAAIWALVTPFVATLGGAWLACRLADAETDRSAAVHGILVWCIGLIAGAIFLTGTLATGAMSAGTAASGNAATARRALQQDGAQASGPRAAARAEDAAKGAAAGAGGAAIAALAGLLGALVGAGLSRRRGAEGKGWRIAIERRQERERHAQAAAPHATERMHERTYPGTGPAAGGPGLPPTAHGPGPGGTAGGEPPGSDPYHH